MTESDKQTGKTFRTLTRAAASASEGKDVCVILPHQMATENAMKMLAKIVACLSGLQFVRNGVRFPGEGRVRLMTVERFEHKRRTGYFSGRKHQVDLRFDT